MRFLVLAVIYAITLFCTASFAHAKEESLIVANSKAWKPYSYLDEKGEPKGILIDIWKAYGAANNVDVTFKLVDWNDSLELVRNGDADVHAGLLWSKQRATYLNFGSEVVGLDTQLYVSRAISELDPMDILTGKTSYIVGGVKGAYEVEFMQAQYPSATLKPYNNNQLMFEAALNGEIDVFVADLQVANYYLNSSSKQTEFLAAKFLYSGDLYFATAIDNSAVLEQISANFLQIAEEDKTRIFSKWMHIETVYPKYLFISVLGLVFLLLAGYATSLRIAVTAKTKQLAKANAELSLLARTDSLTGAYNRRSLMDTLDDYQKVETPLAVMVLDIDDFKQINDQYGHVVGDEVIVAVAHSIQMTLNNKHTVARIGGEEFAVVLSAVNQTESYQLAHDIVDAVAELKISNTHGRQVTISLGCMYYPKAKQFATMVQADRLMYQAKAKGKGCAVVDSVEEA